MLTPDQTRLRIAEAENARLRAEIERRRANMALTIDFLEKGVLQAIQREHVPSVRHLVETLKAAN